LFAVAVAKVHTLFNSTTLLNSIFLIIF